MSIYTKYSNSRCQCCWFNDKFGNRIRNNASTGLNSKSMLENNTKPAMEDTNRERNQYNILNHNRRANSKACCCFGWPEIEYQKRDNISDPQFVSASTHYCCFNHPRAKLDLSTLWKNNNNDVRDESSTTITISKIGKGVLSRVEQILSITMPMTQRGDDYVTLRAMVSDPGQNHHLIEISGPKRLLFTREQLLWDRLISKGGFGMVYEAIVDGRRRAVKISTFGRDNTMSKEHLKNFLRELKSYRMVNHPGIIKYYGTALETGFMAIIVELAPAGNLYHMLHRSKKAVTSATRMRWARQLCSVTAYLHSLNPPLIHGDMKTPNILLDEGLHIKLCDFGKCRPLKNGRKTIRSKFSSPRYMAPESYIKNGLVDEKIDIWALACCLCEIFGAPVPYDYCPNHAAVMDEILRKNVKPQLPTDIHPDLYYMIDRAFSINPANRPTAHELYQAFDSHASLYRIED